jgi:iron(III) transport system substrate-binding protein
MMATGLSKRAFLRLSAQSALTAAIAPLCATLGRSAPAPPDWQAEWTKTVAEAKKEGSVVVGIPSNSFYREFVHGEWTKAFPDIALSQTVLAGGMWFPRVKVERSAGKFLWDVAVTGALPCYQMKDAGFLDPIRPEFILPELQDPDVWGGWNSAFFDRDKEYVLATRSFLKMPYYNAKLISPDKVKALGKDVFLAPELKGKIIWHDPSAPGTGQSLAPVMRRLLGDEGLKRFVQEQVVFAAAASEVVDRTARGQHVIAMGPAMSGELQNYIKAGLRLDIRPLGNTPDMAAYGNIGGSNLIVVKDRPHPNAARLFVNWFLSKGLQTELSKSGGEDARRTDVERLAPADERPVPGVRYFEPQREDYVDELLAAVAYIQQLRKK